MMTAGERKRHRVRGEWASRMHGSSGAGRASSTLRFLPRRPGTCAFWRRPGTQICAPLQQLLASTRLDSRVLGSCSWRGAIIYPGAGALIPTVGVLHFPSRNSAAGSGNTCNSLLLQLCVHVLLRTCTQSSRRTCTTGRARSARRTCTKGRARSARRRTCTQCTQRSKKDVHAHPFLTPTPSPFLPPSHPPSLPPSLSLAVT